MTLHLNELLERGKARFSTTFFILLARAIKASEYQEYQRGRQDALDQVFATDRRKGVSLCREQIQ